MTKEFDFKKYIAFATGIVMTLSLVLAPVVYGQGSSEDAAMRAAEHRETARQRIEARRQNSEERSQEARQTACERRLGAINEATDRLADQADRHIGVFDDVFERVQEFYATGQLTDPEYDQLETDVIEAQTAAQTEAAALNELNVAIDCKDPDVATVVGAFRDSADIARLALQDYRAALVTLISSLRAETADQNTEDNGNTQDESEQRQEDETENEGEV